MMMALAGTKELPAVLVPGESRLRRSMEKMLGRFKLSAFASCMVKLPCRRQQRWDAAPAPRQEGDASF